CSTEFESRSVQRALRVVRSPEMRSTPHTWKCRRVGCGVSGPMRAVRVGHCSYLVSRSKRASSLELKTYLSIPAHSCSSFWPPISVRSTTRRPPEATQRCTLARRVGNNPQFHCETTSTPSLGGVEASTRCHLG